MSDDKLPRIPSFAELGISEDEIEELEREIAKEAEERGGESEADDLGLEAAVSEGAGGRPGESAAASKPRRGPIRKAAAGSGEAAGSARQERAARKSRRGAAARRSARKDAARQAPPEDAPREAAAERGETAGAAATGKGDVIPVPWRGARGPVTLLVLVIAAWLSRAGGMMPSPVPASAPDTVFSSGRAMEHLHRIAAEAHPPGSPAHDGVRDYLLEELRRLGHEPSVQTATSITGGGASLTAATVRNVLARIPGSDSGGRAVLVTAHYDGREISRGAADDGSGVAAILESLRALAAGPGLRNDLIVLFTDAEEIGLLGARAFVDEHPWMQDVAVVLSFEMRGGGGASMMFETGAANGWVIEALRQADPYPSANSVAYEIYQRMPNDTDFTPFKEAGKQGLNFAGIGRPHVYHQAYDSPENFSEATLQHHGEHALAMLRHFGDAGLMAVNAPDVSYISIRYVGLVTYGRLWIWVLGLATVALWTVAFLVAKRSGSHPGRILLGCVASLGCLGVAAVAANQLFRWRLGAHVEVGALHAGTFHSEGWYVLAIVAFNFALVAAALPLIRRWCSPSELTLGALFVPTLLAALTTVMFPMAAVNFQWPVLAGCIGALAVAGLPSDGRMGILRWLVALLATLPVVAVLVPLSQSVWLAMGLVLAPAIVMLAWLVCVLILPALEVVREPNGWWAPVAGLLLAGAFLAVGMSTATPSAARPAPSTLVYALDRETGTAYWGTDPTRDTSDPGVVWAVGAVGSFGEAQQSDLTTQGIPYALRTADPVDLPAPAVAVVSDTTVADGVVRVSVSSQIGAEMLLLRLPAQSPSLVAVNGKPIRGGDRPERITYWGTPEGSILLDFDGGVSGDTGAGLDLVVVEHHLRPGELVGQRYFMRPAELAPNIRMLSDRAMIRTAFAIDPESGEVRTVTRQAENEGEGEPAAEGSPDAEAEPGGADVEPGVETDSAEAGRVVEAATDTATTSAGDTIPADTVRGPPEGALVPALDS
ncbi:MAG: M20/M25/M40 family metallo-hydrolase [Gemmatimonadota bacterium]|nr:M20/M25/M40 family metallo-hydrolase [Gemmatimonadota bacterium]